ncbi:MAG: universal stress protein [Thermoproteota archaeon]
MFKNIVVAFVTKKIKEKPFFVGLGLAKAFDGNVTVIECVYKKPPKFIFFETKEDLQSVEQQKMTAEKSLHRFEELAKRSGLKIKTKVALTESIAEWIVDYVKEHRTDLLILDHPHLSEFEENHYDYIIQTINHEVKVPVLLLRS